MVYYDILDHPIPINIADLTHCQMNQNPCSNQEIHVLFKHGYKPENT